MKIRIMRVLGARARNAVVLAYVDDHKVRWTPGESWTCNCDEDQFPDCPHIPAVENIISERILYPRRAQ